MKQKELYELYLNNTRRINNWDLVDTSARDVIGGYIYHHQELLPQLDELSRSTLLWERRIAVIASSYFIGKGEPDITIALSEALLHDTEDLMHKAVGWMLREVGKRCGQDVLLRFLDHHAHEMPRTMLRYSIEHLSEPTRQKYLQADSPVL
jgi:3-methyladenine DNA glycosylase AlkD